jgi:hypothetical protein
LGRTSTNFIKTRIVRSTDLARCWAEIAGINRLFYFCFTRPRR